MNDTVKKKEVIMIGVTKPKKAVVINLLKVIILYGNLVVTEDFVNLICNNLKEKANAKDVYPKVITLDQLKETLEHGQKPSFVIVMPGFEREDIIEIKRRVPETAQIFVLKEPLEESIKIIERK